MRTQRQSTPPTQSRSVVIMIGILVLGLVLAIALILMSAYRDTITENPWRQEQSADLAKVFEIFDTQGTRHALRAAEALGSAPAIAYFTWRQVAEGKADIATRLAFAIQRPYFPHMKSMGRQILLDTAEDRKPHEVLDLWSLFGDDSSIVALNTFEALKDLNFQGALRERVSEFWRQGTLLGTSTQAEFLNLYGAFLTQDDHIARFHRLLNRNADVGGLPGPRLAAAASSIREYIPADLDLVRVAWATGTPEDRAAVPTQWRRHAALLSKDAWDMQEDDPGQASVLFRSIAPHTQDPDASWRLRRILIRNAIRAQAYGEAYELALIHGLEGTQAALKAELLAGWIMLSYAKLPGLALSHFTHVAETAPGPWLQSKALRGKARALSLLGREGEARLALKECAGFQTTLYALLCLEDLSQPLFHSQSSDPSSENPQFASLFQITQMLVHHDRSEAEVLPFAQASFAAVTSPRETIELSDLLIHRQDLIFTRTSGIAATRGTDSFSARALPTLNLNEKYQSDIEPALTLAIIARESQFRPSVRSSSGATGLMQLLPSTAQAVATDLGLIWTPDLLTNPEENIRLGNAYMARMLARYDGSVLLASAAYNAGPGNVDRWLRDFGDPRKGEIAAEDWIDALTIGETRFYVQRVLTNLYLYRAALSRDDVAIDLNSVMLGS